MTALQQIALQTVLNILVLILAAYKAYGSSYFTQKGKNLADKQDIAEITQKVESIKTEFARETEQLRSDLQLANQVRFSLKTEEKNALVECYERYQFWLNFLLQISFGSINSPAQTEAIEKDIQETYFKVLMGQAKMELYVGRGEYAKHFHDMLMETLKFQNFTSKALLEYSHIIDKREIAYEAVPPTDFTKRGEIGEEYRRATRQLLEEYRTGKLEQYKIIADQVAQFQKMTLQRIAALVEPGPRGHN